MSQARLDPRLGAPILGAVLLGCSLIAAARGQVPIEGGPRPNVLYIVGDDIGLTDVGAYDPESPIPTPNIDALAGAGMRFTDAHSPATLCAPSRYGILTGNYSWRGHDPGGTWNAYETGQILVGQQTLADLLRGVGYHTAFFGKWHLGGQWYRKGSDEFTENESEIDFARRFRQGPLDVGFDYSFLLPSGMQAPPRAFFRNDALVADAQTLIFVAPEDRAPQAGHRARTRASSARDPAWNRVDAGPQLLEEALAFIDRHHQKNLAEGLTTPFYIQYHATEVHAPFSPAGEINGIKIRGRTGRHPRADAVWQLDVIVGELLQALAQRDLLHDTLVVFASDNGSVVRAGDASGLRLSGTKGHAEEGGHRVPLIVRWGDGTAEGSRIAPGSVSRQLIGLQDVVATAAELVGAAPGDDQAVDSVSFLETLLGNASEDHPVRDHLLIWVQHRRNPEDVREQYVVLREGDWKLVVDAERNPVALYNLARSLVESETTNVVGARDQRKRVKRLLRRLDRLLDAPRTAELRQ